MTETEKISTDLLNTYLVSSFFNSEVFMKSACSLHLPTSESIQKNSSKTDTSVVLLCVELCKDFKFWPVCYI